MASRIALYVPCHTLETSSPYIGTYITTSLNRFIDLEIYRFRDV